MFFENKAFKGPLKQIKVDILDYPQLRSRISTILQILSKYFKKKVSNTWVDSKFAEKSIGEVFFCIWNLQMGHLHIGTYHPPPKMRHF